MTARRSRASGTARRPTESGAVDVTVKANDGGAVSERKDGNNEGLVLSVDGEPTGG